jgi:hypothetical protein
LAADGQDHQKTDFRNSIASSPTNQAKRNPNTAQMPTTHQLMSVHQNYTEIAESAARKAPHEP